MFLSGVRRYCVSGKPLLTLFTKDPCPLCHQVKQALEPLKHKFVLQQVDISAPENVAWWDKYKWDIPVLHLNGQLVMKHKLDLEVLNKLLDQHNKK